jgi:hypothetical protein
MKSAVPVLGKSGTTFRLKDSAAEFRFLGVKSEYVNQSPKEKQRAIQL